MMSVPLQSYTGIANAACKHPTKFVSISAHSWLKEASPGLALPMRSSRFNMTAST